MVTRIKDFINRGTMPLVGREREMQILLEAFNGLLEGEPRALWMAGPAGVGKSRLLDELRNRMRDHTARTLVVHAKWYEGEGIEFGPLSNALDVLKPVIAAPVAARIFREGAIANSEAAVEAVQVASRRYPIVLIFDDLHYLDSSAELEKFVAALEEIPVLVIATTRPSENDVLRSFRMALGRSIPPQEVEIGPLDGAGIAEAATTLFGAPPPEGMLGQIAALSAGVPLALREVFRELIAANHIALDQNGTEWTWNRNELVDDDLKKIGDRVHGFSGRLASLPKQERSILALAGYLGEQFNRDLLRRLAEKTIGWDDHGFERLILTGLIAVAVPSIRLGTREGEGRVCYAFTHTLLWKAAASLEIGELPERDKLATHSLEILTGGTGELYSVAALEQVEIARLPKADLARLFDWLATVGRKLAPIYAETFISLCSTALEPVRRSASPADMDSNLLRKYLTALTVYGERLYLTGERETLGNVAGEIADILNRYEDLPTTTEERVIRLDAAVVVWHNSILQGDPGDQHNYLGPLLETLPPPSEQTDRELRGAAEAIRLLTSLAFQRGEFAQTLDIASPYITELDRMRPETLNALMKVLLYAMMRGNRTEEAAEIVEAGLRLRHEADLFTAYELLMHAANYARELHDLQTLRAYAVEARQLTDRYPAYRGLSSNYWHLTHIAACTGDVKQLKELEENFRRTPPPARSTKTQIAIAHYEFQSAWNLLAVPERALRFSESIQRDVLAPIHRVLIAEGEIRSAVDSRDQGLARKALEQIRELISQVRESYVDTAFDTGRRYALLTLLAESIIDESTEDLQTFINEFAYEMILDADGFRAARLLMETAQNSPGKKRELNDAAYKALDLAIAGAVADSEQGLAHHHLDNLKELLPKTRLIRFRQAVGDDPREQNELSSAGEETPAKQETSISQILRTFGALRIEGGEETGTKIESKTRSLVAALIVVKLGDTRWIGELTRDRLADLLWPDMSLDRAVNNLHATMSYARRFLGGSDTILQRDGVYELNEEVRIDAVEFRACISKANRLHDEGVYFGAAVAYRQAVDAADGDFLEGMYADWIDNMRENLRGELATALERLIDIEIDRENFQAVPPLAERLLGLDDLHDGAYEALIRSAAARGARREAFTYFKRYENALDEYGAGPTRRISELIDKVRAGTEI